MISAQHIKKGFTLIEVLVVIGILGILATVALVAINPAEAQKKARDVQRLKDMATLQSVMEQYLSDNPGSASIAPGWGAGVDSSSNTKACATNWIGVNLCAYLNVVPMDPSNRSTKVSDSAVPPTSVVKDSYYYFQYSTGGYKFCTYLESTSNSTKLIGDGGTLPNMFEVFSSSSAGSNCPN